MNWQLAPIVNNTTPFRGIAPIAKRLQVVGEVRPAQAQGNDMIHCQLSPLAASRTATVGGISAKNDLPFRNRAIAICILLACAVTFSYDFGGFRMARARCTAISNAALSIGLAPINVPLVHTLAVFFKPATLSFGSAFWILLAVTLVTITLAVGVTLNVITLVGTATITAAALSSVGVAVVGREVVKGFGNFALITELADNRHRSISLLDWAVPRLLQQRVAFSCPHYTPFLSENQSSMETAR